MRFLFTFCGGSGHFLPTSPIARAVVARGHEVVYACQAAMVESVESAGFSAVDSGGATLLDPRARRPLKPIDRITEERVVRTTFAGNVARQRSFRLLELAVSWRPDVMIRDEMDFGSAVAAETLGVPHAGVVVIAAGGLIRPDLVAAPLSVLRGEHGLAPDPELEMLHRYLTLVPVPPSYRDPRDPLPATGHHLRPAVLDRYDQDDRVPIDGELRRRRPTVYFTLGTVFHQEAGDLFTRVLAGLRDLPFDVVVTVGREIDPNELGNVPSTVRVERFVPQANVLAQCNVVVSHAGSGTVVGALAYGLPSVLLPMGADQPLNADRCAALGVARVLNASTSSPKDIGDAVTNVLEDPSYGAAAGRMRDEIDSLPDSEYAAYLLERLAIDRSPLVKDGS